MHSNGTQELKGDKQGKFQIHKEIIQVVLIWVIWIKIAGLWRAIGFVNWSLSVVDDSLICTPNLLKFCGRTGRSIFVWMILQSKSLV